MGLTIKRAVAGDIPLVAGILSRAIGYKLNHDDSAWGLRTFSHEEVSDMVTSGLTYIAYLENKPVGTVRLQWEDAMFWGEQPPDAGYIHLLAVAPDMHGQGVGKQIIDWAVEQAVQNERQFLRLDCHPDNKGLCAYYEKQGFVRKDMRRITNPLGAQYTAALYERRINQKERSLKGALFGVEPRGRLC